MKARHRAQRLGLQDVAAEELLTPARERRRVAGQRARGPRRAGPGTRGQQRAAVVDGDGTVADAARIEIGVRARRMRELGRLHGQARAAGMVEQLAPHARGHRLPARPLEDQPRDDEARVRVDRLVRAGAGRRGGCDDLAWGHRRVRVGADPHVERIARIARPGDMAEQVAQRRARVAVPRRVPALDRVVETQAAILRIAQRERRGGHLGDAVQRHRRARRHGLLGGDDRESVSGAPLPAVGEDDRRGDAGDGLSGEAIAQLRVERVRQARRQPRPGRRGRRRASSCRRRPFPRGPPRPRRRRRGAPCDEATASAACRAACARARACAAGPRTPSAWPSSRRRRPCRAASPRSLGLSPSSLSQVCQA